MGSVRILARSSIESWSSVLMIGSRPTSSGIIPNRSRSSGVTWATSSLRSISLSGVVLASAEADHLAAEPLADDLLEADERPAADEEDLAGVDLEILLLGMLPAALGRDVGDGPFEQLQEGLLDPFAGDVAGDRDVLAGLADLVDLVDVDDPSLGELDVEIGLADELEDQVLDVLADVTGLGQGRGVADRERDVEPPGQRLRQGGLAAAGRADQQDVALGDLDVLRATGPRSARDEAQTRL